MATSGIKSGANDWPRRTNSLGFAKVDCHTCSALKKHCDRQRPQCGTCRSSRRKCGGFALDLVWKDVAASSTSPSEFPGGECGSLTGLSHHQGQARTESHGFKFIRGRAKRKRKTRKSEWAPNQPSRKDGGRPFVKSPVHTTSPQSVFAGSPDTEAVAAWPDYHEHDLYDDTLDVFQDTDPTYTTSSNSWPDSPQTDGVSTDLNITTTSPIHNYTENACSEDLVPNDNIARSKVTSHLSLSSQKKVNDQHIFAVQFPLTTGVLYQDLAHKYGAILTMYDEEFCILPLSMDCLTNPFRVQKDRSEGSAFLLHAILALSSQHLAKKTNCPELAIQTQSHWSTAIRLFSEALCRSNSLALLDTLLLLVNFESTQSAIATWGIHLNGARNLLEDSGALKICRKTPRLRAQVAMLVWWDVTVAFISRKTPRLSLTYLETLMEYNESDGWSFFTLNGCPAEFVMAMARLAKLASTYDKTTRMEWTSFNRFPVDALIKEIKTFINEEDATTSDFEYVQEDVNARRNRYHCIEAWRHAIVLYSCRVFAPSQGACGMRVIDHLARIILDHVRCIPHTDILQKQVLLPVFLAASEVGDERNRSFVRQWCRHWSVTSRFYMFETAATLLEVIWADWDPSTRDACWWGTLVGHEVWPPSNVGEQHMVSEVLLG